MEINESMKNKIVDEIMGSLIQGATQKGIDTWKDLVELAYPMSEDCLQALFEIPNDIPLNKVRFFIAHKSKEDTTKVLVRQIPKVYDHRDYVSKTDISKTDISKTDITTPRKTYEADANDSETVYETGGIDGV